MTVTVSVNVLLRGCNKGLGQHHGVIYSRAYPSLGTVVHQSMHGNTVEKGQPYVNPVIHKHQSCLLMSV